MCPGGRSEVKNSDNDCQSDNYQDFLHAQTKRIIKTLIKQLIVKWRSTIYLGKYKKIYFFIKKYICKYESASLLLRIFLNRAFKNTGQCLPVYYFSVLLNNRYEFYNISVILGGNIYNRRWQS